MALKHLDGPLNPLLSPNRQPNLIRTTAHLRVLYNLLNRILQSSNSQQAAGDGAGSSPQQKNTLAPERLIGKKWDNHRRETGAQTGPRGSRPSMMDGGRDTREKPIMGHGLDRIDMVWQILAPQPAPASQ
jgi:hypothetical protein